MAEVITVVETINLNIHLRVKSNHGLSTCNWMNVWTLFLNLHISSRQGEDKFAVEKKAQILEVRSGGRNQVICKNGKHNNAEWQKVSRFMED